MKRLVFHPRVAADISQIMNYYSAAGGLSLADDFYAELRRSFARAAEAPDRYAVRSGDLRRVNLERFPYHFLFRIAGDDVRVLVVRHHGRHPFAGTARR